MVQARRRPARVLRVLWAAGVLVALGLMASVVVDAASGLRLRELHVVWLVVSVALFSIAWLAFAAAWVSLNPHGPPLVQAAAWTRSQLLRYLPGAIWAPMARATQVPGRARGRFATVVVEAVVFLATAAAVGGLVGGIAIDARLLLAVPAPLVALAVVHLARRRIPVTTARAAAATAWLLPGWVLYGLASAAGQAAVGSGPSVAAVVAASLVAWAAGFVIVVAPGGAGVREVVYAELLAGTAASSRIAAGAVASRLAFTVAEMLVASTLAAVARRVGAAGRSAGGGRRDADEPGEAGGDPHGLEALSEEPGQPRG